MDKQEFFKRFNKKSAQPLQRGFCEVDGKKYYCLTEKGFYRHAFVNCDSYSYYLFLKAISDIAKSINEEVAVPELVNMECQNGCIKGDIILEDFSKGQPKIEVVSGGSQEGEDALYFHDNITFEEQMEQFKKLSEVCENPQIYQGFLKHFLFHLYFADEDFHFENIEIFKTPQNTTRVSPMFDFSGVYFLNTNAGSVNKGFYHNQLHFAPEFLKEDFVGYYIQSSGEDITTEELDDEFVLDAKKMAKNKLMFGGVSNKEKLKKLVLKAFKDLEDKDFAEKLINIDIDKVLTDSIYNDRLKSLFKAGTSASKNLLAETYQKYKNDNEY